MINHVLPATNLAKPFFGPEYSIAKEEEVGSFDVPAGQTIDVSYRVSGGPHMTILPPGGYVLKYAKGAYLSFDLLPTKFVVGGPRGLMVEWKSTETELWTNVPFAMGETRDEEDFRPTSNIKDMTWIEFTTKHRLRLKAPTNAVGTATITCLRYVPNHKPHLFAENLSWQ